MFRIDLALKPIMAASDIEIINRSLALLGIESITSLSDNSKQASVARVLFDDTRAAVFRGHPWNCLTRRASLPKDVTPPVYGYANRFVLPADFLRLLEVEDPTQTVFQLERRHILSDEGTMNIKYTALITDVTLYDTLLLDTLAKDLSHLVGITNVRSFTCAPHCCCLADLVCLKV